MEKKTTGLVFLASFLGSIAFWTFFTTLTFRGYFTGVLFPNRYVISSSSAIKNDPKCNEAIGKLVSNGVIIDVKDIWALQGDYYGALISVLIAVIGALGVVAFFYVKGSSLEHIREAAEISANEATSKITGSFNFMSEIHSKIDDKIAIAVEDLDELGKTVTVLTNRLTVIETKISTADNSEDEGADLDLNR